MECYCFCETFKISCLLGRHLVRGGDSRRSRHGRAGRTGTFGHHQVWLSQWRARAAGSRCFSQESEHKWSQSCRVRGQRANSRSSRLQSVAKGTAWMWVTKSNNRQFQQGDHTVGHSSGRTCTARLRRRTLRRTDPPTVIRYLIPLSGVGWLSHGFPRDRQKE